MKIGDKVDFILVKKTVVGVVGDTQLLQKKGTITALYDKALEVKCGRYAYTISYDHLGNDIRKFIK